MGGMDGTVTIRLVEEQREGGPAPIPQHNTTGLYWMTHKYTLNMSMSTGPHVTTDKDTSGHGTNQHKAVNTMYNCWQEG